MNLLFVSISQLSKYKIFLGHSIFNTILLSSWLVFIIRGKVVILNLYNTLKMLKLSYILIRYIINMGFPFWFVDFDLTKEDIIKKSSFNTGEFYVTRRWIRGLVSNFFVITRAYRDYLIKKEFIDSNKVRDIFDKWVLTRFSWPRALFVSSTKSCQVLSKETFNSKVSTIGLVDVNVKTYLFNIPIACNDDSLESINYMHGVITQYIIQCKYKKVLIWYYFNRDIRQSYTIVDWFNKLMKIKKKIKYKIDLEKIILPHFVNSFLDLRNGLNFFFGRSHPFKLSRKKKEIANRYFFFDHFYDIHKKYIYNRLNVLNYKNLSYKYRIKFRRYKLLNKIEGISSFKSFLNNFIRLSDYTRRFKRIKVKKRIKMERKKISINFRFFFYFYFFFYLNKFNIIIDSYNRKNFNLHYLIRVYKRYKKKTFTRRYIKYENKDINMKKYGFFYVFRYKSKKLYKRRKQKLYGKYYDSFYGMNKNKTGMGFFFFHWKYFMMFLGLKLRNKDYNFRFRKFNLLKLKKKI